MIRELVPFINFRQIDRAIHRLADEIHYQVPTPVTFICVLDGSFMFTSDLVRQFESKNIYVRFIKASSYKDEHSIGVVHIDLVPKWEHILGKNVVLVEDIVDTGLTAAVLMNKIEEYRPSVLKLCSLLDKPSRRINSIKPNFTGFVIPNKFVVGYGMDYNGAYRHLNGIYTFVENGRVNRTATARVGQLVSTAVS